MKAALLMQPFMFKQCNSELPLFFANIPKSVSTALKIGDLEVDTSPVILVTDNSTVTLQSNQPLITLTIRTSATLEKN